MPQGGSNSSTRGGAYLLFFMIHECVFCHAFHLKRVDFIWMELHLEVIVAHIKVVNQRINCDYQICFEILMTGFDTLKVILF